MVTITIPWPDGRLSPNARTHFRNKAKVAKTARTAAYYLTRQAMGSAGSIPDSGLIPLLVTFCQPDNRARDMDNMIASLKPTFDGIADALKVNDNRFGPTFQWGETEKPGRVIITIGT